MSAKDNAHNHALNRVVNEMLHSAISEYDFSISESARVNSILAEAAKTLRQNFFSIDSTMRKLTAKEEITDSIGEYENAYQQIISTLQFEDIASQIVSQQIKHNRLAQSMLQRMQSSFIALNDEEQCDKREEHLAALRIELESFTTASSQYDSVIQKNLTAGDSEIF